MADDELLIETRPSWWNYTWYLLFAWLVVPFLIAYWRRSALVLRVFHDRVVLEQGVLAKEIKEIFITDIRTIDISQNVLQRIFGIGDLRLASSGTDGWEYHAQGVPDPRGIKDCIGEQRRRIAGSR